MDERPHSLDLSPTEWLIQRQQYTPEEDGLYESLFALTNGRVGLRATVDFEAGGGQPGCFLSDLYGPGLAVRSELVNALHFGYWAVAVGGVPLHLNNATILHFRQSLDLRRAAVSTEMVLRDRLGRTTALSVYTVLPEPEADLLLTVFRLEAVDHSSPIELHSGVDWRRGNGYAGGCEPALRLHHLVEQETRCGRGRLGVCASNRGTGLYAAAATRHVHDAGTGVTVKLDKRVLEVLSFPPEEGRGFSVSRFSAFGTGRDPFELLTACERRADAAVETGTPALLEAHRAAWQSRWADHEIDIDGPADDVQGLRFGLFHLLQSPERRAGVMNIAARGLTSEYHSGHFFFNTELYLVPYYATAEPSVARALIMHRVSTIEAAREHARATGFEGARYPEEADLEGRPAAPRLIHDPFTGEAHEEWSGVEVMHLSADVLYALSRYLDLTGDIDALQGPVLEMVADIARYCASLMKYDPEVGGRGARGVMCFDEFHYHVDHHWATNYLAAWALRWAAETLDAVSRDAAGGSLVSQALEKLGAGGAERRSWKEIASEVYLPPPDEGGVYPQFRGYLSLRDQLARRGPHHRLPEITEDDKRRMDALLPFETRLIKQADVLLVMAMFPDAFGPREAEANFAFYDPRTAHASSLSTAPHASVAARLGNVGAARQYLVAALRYNLDFEPRAGYMNGVHLAGYAGACNALLEGFLGFRSLPDGITLAPKLPREWAGVRLRVSWRRYRFEVAASHENLLVKWLAGPEAPVTVHVRSESKQLSGRQTSATFILLSRAETEET